MRLLAFILLLIVNVPAMAQEQPRPDPMRGFIWGLPRYIVMENEKAELAGEDAESLLYKVALAIGPDKKVYDTLVEYRFDGKGLSRVTYSMRTNLGNAWEAVSDVMVWQGWLDDILDQTTKPQFSFQNPRNYHDPLRWGGAVYRGQGHIRIDWHAEETSARLNFSAYTHSPRIIVTLSPDKTSRNP